MSDEAQERAEAARLVAVGGAWLDTVYPQWFERVDLELLDMSNAFFCVVGQAFGRWPVQVRPGDYVWMEASGYSALSDLAEDVLGTVPDGGYVGWLADRAFTSYRGPGWGALEDAWADAVEARRGQAVR